MDETFINCIALIVGIVALVIGVIAFVESVLAFKAHTRELHESTEVKRLEIKELHESMETKRLEIKVKLMNKRRDLLKYLRELIVFPRNYIPYFMLRRTVTIPFLFDESQPLLHGRNKSVKNQYYQTILNEFQSMRADIELYFPYQLAEYDAFLDSAAKTESSIEYHRDSGEIKCWNHELGERTFEQFDLFLNAANKSIGCI